MRISVLIADDHAIVRRGLRAVLESESDIAVVGEAADGNDLFERVRTGADVLILEPGIHGLSGADALKRVIAAADAMRIVIFSTRHSDNSVLDALRAGAMAYVLKDASAAELVAAVRSAASGHRYLSSRLAGDRLLAQLGGDNAASDPLESLTARERQVLTLAARGVTSREIGVTLSISRRTAETHRANVLRKLGLKGQQDLIRYALRRGIVEM